MGELGGTSVREGERDIKRDWAGFRCPSEQVKRFSSLGVFTQMRKREKRK